jgi:beta-lactamase superfamily II metal-dependent hydrolase
MEINIQMPNVNDGDAIIIHLKKSDNQQLVILIDGGHGGDAKRITDLIDPLLKLTKRPGPDLIICTHYDLDHIGGLKKIAKHYGEKIGQFWIHHPHIITETLKYGELLNEQEKSFASQDRRELKEFKKTLIAFHGARANLEILLESYSDMQELVDFLQDTDIPIKEPFPGITYPGWPEIKVLGPTLTFYNTLLDQLTPKRILLSEILHQTRENKMTAMPSFQNFLKESTQSACEKLDNQKKDNITPVNQVSIILQISDESKKYLFTGDASIESFKNIPEYTTALKDIYWLKVAHHGSHNNSSSELFNIMKPKYAYISGRKYLDPEVTGCLKAKGTIVKTTLDNGDLKFPE